MAKTQEKKEKKCLLRFPVKLHKQIQGRAEQNKRSFNSQVIFELDKKPVLIFEDLQKSIQIRENITKV